MIDRLANEKCATCGGSVDHDEYGECEECGKFFCADHNELRCGICPDCFEKIQEEQFREEMPDISFKPFRSLIARFNNQKISRDRLILEWGLVQKSQGVAV